ncbi:MAG: hypothetical protein JNK87_09325 [Bryobacterales bacterium]|nr:hypothetical protein [Bryobacterales bacterium]
MKNRERLRKLHRLLARLHRDQTGQDMIEYALLTASVAVLVAGFLPANFFPSYIAIWTRMLDVMRSLTGISV